MFRLISGCHLAPIQALLQGFHGTPGGLDPVLELQTPLQMRKSRQSHTAHSVKVFQNTHC